MVEPDNKLNNETLRKIQAGIADLRNGQADIRQDVRDLKTHNATALVNLQASNATILGLLGELVKATGRESDRLASIEARLSDLEQRVVEQEHRPLT